MIDLHTHVLPGFDDGASDWQTAVTMCRQAKADGIDGLVATPHYHRGIFPTPQIAEVHSATMELQALCEKALIHDFTVYVGADCHLHGDILDNLRGSKIPTVNGSRYLLLEFPDETLPPHLTEIIFEVCMAGVTPIITHPERNRALAKDPLVLYDLVQGGAYAQLTAASLTGLFGSSVQRAGERMLEWGLVQVIASDAHDPEHRPPVLSRGRDAAVAIVGEELAQQMVNDVPRAVLANEHVRFPEPVRPRTSRKPLWRRIIAT